jgi:hypothetical protein
LLCFVQKNYPNKEDFNSRQGCQGLGIKYNTMKVIIAGSTGMVGSLILDLCIESEKIDEMRTLVRKPTG